MTPVRWKQVRDVFDRALEVHPSGLHSFLTSTCGDPELRREVESLLASARRPANPMDVPLFSAGAAGSPAAGFTPGFIAGYWIVAKLGEGGMAEVFEATAPAGHQVALKLFRQGSSFDGDIRRLFLREARLAGTLRHPNIVRILHVIDEQALSAIVMELVQGEPLSAHIPPEGMAIDRALHAGIEICAALAEAHSHGIVHRDLKPANVMLDRAGSARVLDFGAARQLFRENQTDSAGASTANGMVIGTPVYMSPEQVRGERVDFRSDVFSLGSLLYEMIAGRPPFKRRSVLATMSAIVQEPARPIREMRYEVPERLAAIIAGCLSKDLPGRFQTIGDTASALRSVM